MVRIGKIRNWFDFAVEGRKKHMTFNETTLVPHPCGQGLPEMERSTTVQFPPPPLQALPRLSAVTQDIHLLRGLPKTNHCVLSLYIANLW